MKYFKTLLTICLGLLPLFSMAATKEVSNKARYDNILYNVDHQLKTAVVGYNPKLSGDIDIPEQIEVGEDLYTVIGVSDKAFKGGKGITHISLPQSIRFVHRSAFTDTEWYNNKENWGELGTLYIDSVLISVDPDSTKRTYRIPHGTTVIAVGALLDCKDIMATLWVPETVTEIAEGTFRGMHLLKRFHLGSGIRRIGKGAFAGTAAYAYENYWKKGVLYIDTCLIEATADIKPDYIVKPESRVIADGAFKDNLTLHSIILSPRYKHIGDETFCGCGNLAKVEMSDSVQTLGYQAFCDCANLKEIRLSKAINRLGIQCFSGCIRLENIRLPQGIRVLPDATFFRCSSLLEVKEWPAGLREIGKGCFRECGKLYEIKNLPGSLNKIGEGAFANCMNLQTVILPDSVIQVTAHMFDGCGKLSKAVVSENVYDISDYAFNGCIALETFHLPEYLFSVGDYAFLNCTALRKIALPDAVQRIEEGAFCNCFSLEVVDIPLKLKYIDKMVFSGCKSLRKVLFHTHVESVGELSFENCRYLKEVLLPEGCEVHKDAFKGTKTEIKFE